MTKPTGRPRGRPKTKHYVTLMARVDVALADQVKRCAALHKQPLSVVIRDALALLMDEYPAGAARSGPQRLAAHEFLSDRYEAPLDLLLEGTDSAERDALLSYTNEVAVDIIWSYMNWGEPIASDTKAGSVYIVSDTNMPPYDQGKYVLGAKLCPGKHEWGHTGKTLLTLKGRKCKEGQTEGQHKRRAKR